VEVKIMAETKLSKAQFNLLWQLKAGPVHAVSYYQPGRKLVEAGLAVWNQKEDLCITEEGKAWLRGCARPETAL
jgi:hypothetical protein